MESRWLKGSYQIPDMNNEFIKKLEQKLTKSTQAMLLEMHTGKKPCIGFCVPNYNLDRTYLAITGKTQVKQPEEISSVYDWQPKDLT